MIPDPIATKEAVRISLEVGFRQFDCAERYRNEEQVGEAMRAVFKEGKVKRKEVFVGTKLWNNNHRTERVRPAFEASLRRLQLDYVDLYCIHTPFAFKPGDEQDPRDENGKVIYDVATMTRASPGSFPEQAERPSQRSPRTIKLYDRTREELTFERSRGLKFNLD